MDLLWAPSEVDDALEVWLPEEGILYGGAATPGDMIPTIGTPLLGGIPAKVAAGGASAGGCIAAAMTLMARDRNGPAICHQHLLIPVIDDRLETPSAQRIHDPRVWNRANADAAWRLYLGPTHAGTPSPYAAPGRSEDLSGLPPATVLVEEMDLLRDEAVAYAGRLTAAGARCELHVYPGTFHGLMAFVPGAQISRRSIRDFIDGVARSFG